MYTVFEVQISGELDPAKLDAYSWAVQMTTPQTHQGKIEVCLFYSSHSGDLKDLLDTDPSIVTYRDVGIADEYGRIARG